MKNHFGTREKNQRLIIGNSVDISMKTICESEIKADIIVKEVDKIRLWGQVKDCKDNPVSEALIKLVKKQNGRLHGVAHTISDCQGFYQFDLCGKDPNAHYKVIVSKTVECSEKVIDVCDLNCNNCDQRESHCSNDDCDKSNQTSSKHHCKHHSWEDTCVDMCTHEDTCSPEDTCSHEDTCPREDTCETCKHFCAQKGTCSLK